MGYRDESGRVRELEEGGSGFAKRRGATGHATGMSSRELNFNGREASKLESGQSGQ